MITYICLLRGINVGGHKKLKMSDLRELCMKIGLQNVATYLQSGNVIFQVDDDSIFADSKNLSLNISTELERQFGFAVSCFLLKKSELEFIVKNNIFLKHHNKNPNFFHVTFYIDAIEDGNFDAKTKLQTQAQQGEEIIVENKVAYLYCPNGYGRTKLSNHFLETKLKTLATTRNWKTVNELLLMAQNIDK